MGLGFRAVEEKPQKHVRAEKDHTIQMLFHCTWNPEVCRNSGFRAIILHTLQV